MMTRKFYRILAGNIRDNYQHDLQKYPNPVEAEQRRESAMRIAVKLTIQSSTNQPSERLAPLLMGNLRLYL